MKVHRAAEGCRSLYLVLCRKGYIRRIVREDKIAKILGNVAQERIVIIIVGDLYTIMEDWWRYNHSLLVDV